MTASTHPAPTQPAPTRSAPTGDDGRGDGNRTRRRASGRPPLSWPQRAVVGLASIAPVVIVITLLAGALGLISVETMIEVALGAGENPGMITFGALFLASPVQWATGRSQVRVRARLGIIFFLLSLSNGAMFVVESGLAAALGAPFLIAGSVALALATPLFLTSNRWSQRTLGMRRWRLLHRLTYPLAVALLAHVVLLGDVGLGAVLITAGFIARLPAVRRRLERRAATKRRDDEAPKGELTSRV